MISLSSILLAIGEINTTRNTGVMQKIIRVNIWKSGKLPYLCSVLINYYTKND
jgi:hypothetical protein